MDFKELAENDKKKEYLKGYERAVRQMERCKERIQEIRLSILPSAINTDGMPHGHNSSDLSPYAVLLDQEERKYKRAMYKRAMKCKEITDRIEKLENEDEKDVLTYRYIQLLKWEDICVIMKHSWQHVHRIHSRALENLKM